MNWKNISKRTVSYTHLDVYKRQQGDTLAQFRGESGLSGEELSLIHIYTVKTRLRKAKSLLKEKLEVIGYER